MTFQVEILPIAQKQIEQAYSWYRERNAEFADRWFRGLMNAIATLQEKPLRCPLAIENDIFPEDIRQLLYGKSQRKSQNIYRVLFAIRDTKVHILYVRHSAQMPLTLEKIQELEENY